MKIQKQVIWEEPGGAMTMIQLPDITGRFLSTQEFYFPDDCRKTRIVPVTPEESGE